MFDVCHEEICSVISAERGKQPEKAFQALPMLSLNFGSGNAKFLHFLLDISAQTVLWVDEWGCFRQFMCKR